MTTVRLTVTTYDSEGERLATTTAEHNLNTDLGYEALIASFNDDVDDLAESPLIPGYTLTYEMKVIE